MNIVIIGAGLAGANAVTELRDQGYPGDITLLGAEPHPPYERPPLSKGLLLGSADPDSVFVHDPAWYAEQQVELLTDTTVTDIDLDTRHVSLGTRQLSYDRLLLATGSRPRQLPVADRSGADVAYLRTLEDSLALVERLTDHLLVIGAGWLGLEVAAAAREAGGTVTVVDPAPLPLAHVLGGELGRLVADVHREHGVDLRLRTTVASIDHTHGRTTVHLSDGHTLSPDLILVAIGAEPDDRLAASAGLATDNGVLIDARLRTSDPHVYAAGDVANHDHPQLGRIRVEHWDTAIHQGRHAARAMLGNDTPYNRQPYFFTDQYDLGLEYVGHVGPKGFDEIVLRGDPADLVVNALWLRDNQVVAGAHVNDWDSIGPIRAWVGREADAALRDPDTPLSAVVPTAAD
jgi:NADPH-dependent 2,4-dienoyl-CoA reductase/sulfur reductase-like enzyme